MNLSRYVYPTNHKKAWGEEEWLVNSALYCCKRLLVYPMRHCSIHKHGIKSEVFYVEDGELYLELFDNIGARSHEAQERIFLRTGDCGVEIPPNTWHRFTGGDNGANILEISTQHSEDDVSRASCSGAYTPEEYEEITSRFGIKDQPE